MMCRLSLWFGVLLLLSQQAFSQVTINEFMADNTRTLTDEDLQHPDWIELYNGGTTPVNLAGWSLTDDPTRVARWTFPQTNISSKGFLVVFASGKNRAVPGAPLHTSFSLKAAGEYLALLRPDGTVATEFSPTYPEQFADFSYGLAQDVVTNTFLAAGAPGRILIPNATTPAGTWVQPGFNDSVWRSGKTGIGYQSAVDGFAVSNILANVFIGDLATANGVISNRSQQIAVYAENAPMINYFNTGGEAHYGNNRTFPGLIMGIEGDNFVTRSIATITIPLAGVWTFGVNSDDGFGLSIGSFKMAFTLSRGPDDTLQSFVIPTAGDYPLELVQFQGGGGAGLELFAARGSFGAWDAVNFHLVGDTANGGLAVKAPAVSTGTGSYKPQIATDVQSLMLGSNATAYIRVPFTITNRATVGSLVLRMKYDDGFVAYLNGQMVASRNAPASPLWNSVATASHDNAMATVYEEINISDYLGALVTGTNILAIQGLNRSASDNDFLIVPEVVEYKAAVLTNRYFSTASPGTFNSSGFVAFVGDTKFSVGRGFYDIPFSLSITSSTAGATILYTTNGSTPSLTNGYAYSTPLSIRGTTIVRAAAFRTGFVPSNVDTESYIFVGDVIRQSPAGQVPTGWPASWGANVVDYGMDPDVVNNAFYSAEMTNDLKAIPTFSIVTDLPNLFDPVTGIYANAAQDGIDWERPASVELIYADGRAGFHSNAGLRIRGGYSRSTGNPKHAFRVFFRQEYGASKLKFPLFAAQGGTDSYDCFDLRTFENYSWSFEGDYRFIAMRDQWSRDTQVAQGWPGERGNYYHLYIDGQYWGIYNTAERPEASYGESYFGGIKEDYDVIKVDTSAGYTMFATDGNMDAWTRLWQAATNGFSGNIAYNKVQGLNPDGTRNPAYENLLDVDNLIDYMLVIFFTGNIDAPISAFIGNTNPNNTYAMRNRTGLYGGFRFLAHDSEHTLLHESSLGSADEIHRDRTGPFAAGDPVQQGAAAALGRSNPQYLFTRLTANLDFRVRFADRVYKQFYNGGVLSTVGCRSRLLSRSNELYSAIAAESARWGDSKRATPATRNVEWVTEVNRVYGDYFGQRPGIVLGQFQAKGWYPTVAVPILSQLGGLVTNGFKLSATAPAGTVYYTRDGSDPRMSLGAISSSAVAYSGPITITQGTRIRARALLGVTWSAVCDVTFYIRQDFRGLLATEVMYHPPPSVATNYTADDFEFIELKNASSADLDLSGLRFTNGITCSVPVGTIIGPGQFVVLVSNPEAFTNKYPGVRYNGVYEGRLSNSGETLTLTDPAGTPVLSFAYDTRPPWPATADGTGFSLVPLNQNYNPDPSSAAGWRASSNIGGSPGKDDLLTGIPQVFVNEALTHTDLPQLDSIELYNPNPTNVDVGNWYITDQRTMPFKFRIPAPYIIPANGFAVFTENNWNADPASTNSFRLDSHGEEIYLFSADTNGTLTGYSDGFAFGSARNGVTFGRHVTSNGEVQYPAQIVNTLGARNAGPRIGPLVINEIQYHPPIGGDEFIELRSLTNGPLRLYDPAFPTNTWHINGVGFEFPTNTVVAANSLMLVVGIDPAAFRSKYGVPAEVPVFGPYTGTLQDSGESLAVQCPDQPDLMTNNGTIFVPYIDVDVVRYNDKSPWPTNADGAGASIQKIIATSYGNEPANWRASVWGQNPGYENGTNQSPLVNAGSDATIVVSNAPIVVTLNGSANDDGVPEQPGVLAVSWTQVGGPGVAWFSNPTQPGTTVTFPGVGQYTLRLSATDGEKSSSDDVIITIQHPIATGPITLVPTGSVWKYLDNGTDQGTNWTGLGFNDSTWASGPAPLGYGDANGILPATVNSFGPDGNNKYVTTYYRRRFNVQDPLVVTNLVLGVQRDDGVMVYLNGTPVFTNNMPTDQVVNYLSYTPGVVGGADEVAIYTGDVDPRLLIAGTNVITAEVHQCNASSSDIYFELSLAGELFAPNQVPVVNAGIDQDITLPASATLGGAVSDDGLPIPPGLLTFAWSRVSGPGPVLFGGPTALATIATFAIAGNYVLRLSVSDGVSTGVDDVTVRVANAALLPFGIEATAVAGGTSPSVKIGFTAAPGLAYSVQYRLALGTGRWLNLTNIAPGAISRRIEITDPIPPASDGRFYRVSQSSSL